MGRYLELLKQSNPQVEVVPEVRPTPLPVAPDGGVKLDVEAPAPPTILTTETTKAPHLPFAPTQPALAIPASEQQAAHRRLEASDPEIAWRLDAMRNQVQTSGPIPFLVARNIRPAAGACQSCGDPLEVDQPYRCRPCVEAATLALRESRDVLVGKRRDEALE